MKNCLKNVRKKCPLVHCITNYVTVNDVANALLAVGGSPIMSDDIAEVEEITSICSALVINIGTLNARTIQSMITAGKKANELCHPVVLDPVGAGASVLRTQSAMRLLNEVKFEVIRGNISEIKTIASGAGFTMGVDACQADCVTEQNLESTISFVKSLAQKTGALIAVTGKIDLVADSEKCYIITNGTEQMSKITGTGCQLSAITAAFVAANPDSICLSTAAAVCAMGFAGETAAARMSEMDGNCSMRNYIIDALYNMDGNLLESGAKYEIR